MGRKQRRFERLVKEAKIFSVPSVSLQNPKFGQKDRISGRAFNSIRTIIPDRSPDIR